MLAQCVKDSGDKGWVKDVRSGGAQPRVAAAGDSQVSKRVAGLGENMQSAARDDKVAWTSAKASESCADLMGGNAKSLWSFRASSMWQAQRQEVVRSGQERGWGRAGRRQRDRDAVGVKVLDRVWKWRCTERCSCLLLLSCWFQRDCIHSCFSVLVSKLQVARVARTKYSQTERTFERQERSPCHIRSFSPPL